MGGVFLPGKSKIFVILRTPQSAFLPRSYHPHFFIFYFPLFFGYHFIFLFLYYFLLILFQFYFTGFIYL